jgi:UDP-GlcNAc:undecaprenyl-phosphate GlcNAc-1-phosphate transferase
LSTIGLIFAFGASLAFGLLFTPLVRGVAIRWNLCDKPNGRTCRGIAHIGGIAIIGAIVFTLIPIFLFYLPGDQLQRAFIPILIASGFLVFILGIIDDLRSLHYLYKFCLQVVVSLFVAFFGYALLERFGLVHLPLYLVLPTCFSVALWMLVVTTSFNLIDGLDGLASGLALIAAASYATAAYLAGQGLVVAISLVLAGAVLGFLRYNFPPAKIFMGDSGSLFLGLLFGLVSLLSLVAGGRLFFVIAGNVIVLSVPILDTVLAFTRRALARRPVMEADHRHIHHVLLYRFRSVVKADLVLWALAVVFGCLGVLTMRGNLGALVSAIVLEVAVFASALAAMVRIELPADVEAELLDGSGITASRISSRS